VTHVLPAVAALVCIVVVALFVWAAADGPPGPATPP